MHPGCRGTLLGRLSQKHSGPGFPERSTYFRNLQKDFMNPAAAPETEIARYPIGEYAAPAAFDPTSIRNWIDLLENFPRWLDVLIENLDEAQLHTPYRPGGWSMQQIIHHLADSHMVAYTRLKLALTEENPTVAPYREDRWAETPEVAEVPVNVSITLLHALHRRWAALLRALPEADWHRTFYHPERGHAVAVWELIHFYVWHSRHHAEQMRQLREREAWKW